MTIGEIVQHKEFGAVKVTRLGDGGLVYGTHIASGRPVMPFKPAKPRAAVREADIRWNAEIVNFILTLSLSPKTRLYFEAKDIDSRFVENKYMDLTGVVIVPTPGQYNLAPPEKWAAEGTLYFDPTIAVPDSLGIVPEKDGQINNVELFWALVRLGFRLGETPNPTTIAENIPVAFRAAVVV